MTGQRLYFHARSMADVATVLAEALWHLIRPVADVVIEREWTDGCDGM